MARMNTFLTVTPTIDDLVLGLDNTNPSVTRTFSNSGLLGLFYPLIVNNIITQTISIGVTDKAPSSNAVYEALLLKQKVITLTTLGTNGIATFNPTTGALNIPESTDNQNLQSVTNNGASTTNSITANSFIKIGGTGTNVLLDNGSTVALSSIVGNTNLSTSQTATNFTINSSTGDDAVVPLGNGTDAGATLNNYTTAEKNKLAGIASGAEVNINADWNAVSGDAQILNKPTISGTNTGDQNLQQVTDLGASTTNSITANSFVKSGGTSSQILAADGSVITQGNNITITGGVISSVGGSGGGGSSVNYYLNGGTSQGTFGGVTYYEFSKTAVIGTGADFSRGSNGLIASFITDAADPSLLLIPGGNWNLEFFFSSSSAGGSPSFYVELYKYNGTTFTLITSNSTNPEGITGGTSIDAYFTPLAVPETILTVNDRLAIRVFVNASSKTITLHTQNGHLCEVITTFTSGLTALNGLQAQVQNFATGTTGTDFDIVSSGNTHTFNLPSASATARGVVTTGSQTFAGLKTFSSNIVIPATGSELILSVGSGGIVNGLTTTTYPSLTELTYVKGVTSAIQTQLNAKQPINANLTSISALSTASGASFVRVYNGAYYLDNGNYLTSVGIFNLTATGTPSATTYLRGDNTWATVSGGSGTVTSVAALTLTSTVAANLSSTVANGTTTPVITLNVPDAGPSSRGVITTGTQTIAGAKTFSATPSTSVTPAASNNSTLLATTEYVDRQVGLGGPAYNILITSTIGITTVTTGTSNSISYSQNGRNVMIQNTSTNITITVDPTTPTDFIASYTKLSVQDVTITFLQTNITTWEAPNGFILSGRAGSTALLTRNGTSAFLLINNIV